MLRLRLRLRLRLVGWLARRGETEVARKSTLLLLLAAIGGGQTRGTGYLRAEYWRWWEVVQASKLSKLLHVGGGVATCLLRTQNLID